MAKLKFPNELFVKYEDGGSGPDYLGTYQTPAEAAGMGEKTKVAIYRLYEVHEIGGVVNIKRVYKPR